MFRRIIKLSSVAVACVLSVSSITGCGVAASIGTAAADAEQKPQVSSYASKQAQKAVFPAAAKAMSAFGTVVSSDRDNGIVQGQKGNWVMTASIAESKPGSRIELSARYVPGKKMDLNSREGLTAEYLAKLQKELNESLTQVQ